MKTFNLESILRLWLRIRLWLRLPTRLRLRFIGRYVIVRTYSAGVFAGILHERNGKEALIKNARRLWYWDGAASLSQLAQEGTSKPPECKFPCEVDSVLLTEVIEILEVSKTAKESIRGVKEWRA